MFPVKHTVIYTFFAITSVQNTCFCSVFNALASKNPAKSCYVQCFFHFWPFFHCRKATKMTQNSISIPSCAQTPKNPRKMSKTPPYSGLGAKPFLAPPAKADIATAILTNVIEHLVLLLPPNKHAFTAKAVWADFVVILTPHNSPLKGKRLVWSTKCLDILYCPTVFRDFPFCSCHFLLHLFNASPVPFPWQPFPYLSHGTFCRYFWILSFLVWFPTTFAVSCHGSQKSILVPKNLVIFQQVILAQCQHPLFSHHHYPMLVPLKEPLKIILSSSIIPWLLPTPTFLDEDLWFHGCCLDAALCGRCMHRGRRSRRCQWRQRQQDWDLFAGSAIQTPWCAFLRGCATDHLRRSSAELGDVGWVGSRLGGKICSSPHNYVAHNFPLNPPKRWF